MTVATWPVVFVRPVVSACICAGTIGTHHIFRRRRDVGTRVETQPEQGRSGSNRSAEQRSDFYATTRVVGPGKLGRSRELGRTRSEVHSERILSAVSRMFDFSSGDPRHRSRLVIRPRASRRRRDHNNSLLRLRVRLSHRSVNFCEVSDLIDFEISSLCELAFHKLNADIAKQEQLLGRHSADARAPKIGAGGVSFRRLRSCVGR